MEVDISYMNGSPVDTRGIPATCLLNTKVSEWIENNTNRPSIIRFSQEFRKELEKEYGSPLFRVITLVGTLDIIVKDIEDYGVEIY